MMEPLEPLMVGETRRRTVAEQEPRLSSFLGLDETEEAFISWLETYKLDAKRIDVTSRWGLCNLLSIRYDIISGLFFQNKKQVE